MLELLALATEELTLWPVKLLGEDCDLILQILILLVEFFVHQSVGRFTLTYLSSMASKGDLMLFFSHCIPRALSDMLEVDPAEQDFANIGFQHEFEVAVGEGGRGQQKPPRSRGFAKIQIPVLSY
jgi:hypothetical protein